MSIIWDESNYSFTFHTCSQLYTLRTFYANKKNSNFYEFFLNKWKKIILNKDIVENENETW